ncbi:MAG: hypothetical protein WBP82_09895 [Leuconostoc mesenteroides]
MKRIYTENEIEEVKKLVETLREFTNKEISIINDGKPCSDSNRNLAIIDIITSDYGDEILMTKGLIKF